MSGDRAVGTQPEEGWVLFFSVGGLSSTEVPPAFSVEACFGGVHAQRLGSGDRTRMEPGDDGMAGGKILMIDNYDSFTYNLVQFLGILGADLVVFRNDHTRLEQVEELRPAGIVISPGPKAPRDAGLSKDIIREFGPRVPILGVCLGHQCIGEVYGGRVDRAPYVMHGKTSLIYHDGKGVFRGLPSPMEAARYHSLAILEESFPECLEVSARTEDGLIMAVRHRRYPVEGIQFHPESFMTPEGLRLLGNFLEMCLERGTAVPGQAKHRGGGARDGKF